MKQNRNPLLIVLGVCGGCVLLCIIGGVILSAVLYSKGKGLVGGAMEMAKNMPLFLTDLKAKNYVGASGLIDPTVQNTYTATKIQHMEEAVEKKLGPMVSIPQRPTNQGNNTNTENVKPGQMPGFEWTYTYTIQYQKGNAVATFKFKTDNVMKPGGKITAFDLKPE